MTYKIFNIFIGIGWAVFVLFFAMGVWSPSKITSILMAISLAFEFIFVRNMREVRD